MDGRGEGMRPGVERAGASGEGRLFAGVAAWVFGGRLDRWGGQELRSSSSAGSSGIGSFGSMPGILVLVSDRRGRGTVRHPEVADAEDISPEGAWRWSTR